MGDLQTDVRAARGYYTLPILYDDRLVGRLDPRLDRTSAALEIPGFWLEEGVEADLSLAEALGRGLAGSARFLQARTVDLREMRPPRLRALIREAVHDRLSADATG
ncbi:MAG: hypothetical protein A2Z17_03845 [Gammaproteobacteria bacterium RBG_16_66_13]|nr:MAG: hypothetical protein A2Z17_03845 [Gammaproteobacteria bacterium RBG_16_66_13]